MNKIERIFIEFVFWMILAILKFHRSELNKISFESMEKSSDGQLNNGEHTTKTEEFCTAFPANLLNTSSIIKLVSLYQLILLQPLIIVLVSR